MLIIWDADRPVTRAEIEEKMDDSRDVLPNTVLALLSRLEKRGFVKKERDGKINHYSALVEREPYMKEASKGILKQMFQGSLKNFAAALYDGEELSEEDAKELMEFLESKVKRERYERVFYLCIAESSCTGCFDSDSVAAGWTFFLEIGASLAEMAVAACVYTDAASGGVPS